MNEDNNESEHHFMNWDKGKSSKYVILTKKKYITSNVNLEII